jgi:hypothetical protein
VVVTEGAATSRIDVQLQAGGRISGAVRESSGGPLAGVGITVQGIADENGDDADDADGADGVRYATTAADGGYSVVGLPAGSYSVWFDPSTGGSDGGPVSTDAPRVLRRRRPGRQLVSGCAGRPGVQ